MFLGENHGQQNGDFWWTKNLSNIENILFFSVGKIMFCGFALRFKLERREITRENCDGEEVQIGVSDYDATVEPTLFSLQA